MKTNLMVIGIVAGLFISGCGSTTKSEAPSGQTTIATTTDPAIPPLEATNSTIDCTGWAEGSQTYIRNQGQIVIRDVLYGVGSFACGVPNSELGTEFIESFVFAQGVWASNGLVSGPELQFMTIGECSSSTEITCPAVVLDQGSGSETEGAVVVFEKDGGLAWRFDAS